MVQEVWQGAGHTDQVQSVAWQWEGKLLASQAKDKTLRVWDPRSEEATLETESHSSSFWSGLETWQLVAVISLSVLVSVLFVIMLLVLCCGRKKAPTLKYLEKQGRRSILANVNEKSGKFNESELNAILENSYVSVPYSSSASSSSSSIEYSRK